jgi:methylenetetrahydrofolate dehydrogenase (NADP+)/methenyltetrahydrofolate cyclohydrolase
MKLLEREGIDLQGKNAVVLGRSETVGKPMAMLLLNANATVTVCHSKTQNLKEICRNADVLISAIGKSKFVTADMVKDGAVVIDVGINRDEFGKLCGDVDFENVKDKTSFITPVPGGVGPMTITMLMYNTYITACKE